MGAFSSKGSNNTQEELMMVNPPSSRLHVTSMLHRNAQQYPDNLATIDAASGREKSYQVLVNRVARLANGLRKEGLSYDGRIGLVMMNSDRYLESFFAASWAGGIFFPVNIRLAPMEMLEQFNDCGVEFIIVDDAFKGILDKIKGKVL